MLRLLLFPSLALLGISGCSTSPSANQSAEERSSETTEAKKTARDMTQCQMILDWYKMGKYYEVEKRLSVSELSEELSGSTGDIRVFLWQLHTILLYDFAKAPWESSNMVKLQTEAATLLRQGDVRVRETRNPEEWHALWNEFYTLGDELLLSCGG